MARIPEDVIQAVQDSVDIVDFLSRYVPLKRSGSSFQGLCPFHEEKTPSFTVFPDSRRFKCFGCGESGDIFGFLMKRGNLRFREAVEEIAREGGIVLPEERDAADDPQAGRRRAALKALRFAAGFYRAVLARAGSGGAARDYLEGRGISAEIAEEFGLGFSPPEEKGFSRYAQEKGFGEEALFDAGLIRRRQENGAAHDMFRGRIMFPIHDLRGNVVGFGARAMGDRQPKYLNSPDGPVFHKGREMYGLFAAQPAARKARRLLVVEGYTDVIACRQAGIAEAAAGLGTALTPENARTLARLSLPIVLLYDGDEAGRRAAERAADVLLAERADASVALLPAGQDPADAVSSGGAAAIEEAVAGAEDLFDYRLARACARHDESHLEGRRKAAEELLETIGRMADPLRRDVALKLLSERLGVPESTLRDRLTRLRRPAARKPAVEVPAAAEPSPPAGWAQAEAEILAAVLQEGPFWDRLVEVYPPERFRDPALRTVAEAIQALRRPGETLTRQALLGVLVDSDEAAYALQRIEPLTDAVSRAEAHLERIRQDARLQDALLDPEPLAAVVNARRTQTTHKTQAK